MSFLLYTLYAFWKFVANILVRCAVDRYILLVWLLMSEAYCGDLKPGRHDRQKWNTLVSAFEITRSWIKLSPTKEVKNCAPVFS